MSFPEFKQPHEWTRFGDVVVAVTKPGTIDDALWNTYMSFLDTGDVRIIFSLTSDDVPGITATQRKKAADLMQRRGIMAVVLTNSRLIRGVLTAVSWLGAQVKAFAWTDLERAVQAVTPDLAIQKKLVDIANTFKQKAEQ